MKFLILDYTACLEQLNKSPWSRRYQQTELTARCSECKVLSVYALLSVCTALRQSV